MCIVMVRRMFVEDEHAALWPELSDAGKANAAPGAARALLSASHPALMEKVADATACIVGTQFTTGCLGFTDNAVIVDVAITGSIKQFEFRTRLWRRLAFDFPLVSGNIGVDHTAVLVQRFTVDFA